MPKRSRSPGAERAGPEEGTPAIDSSLPASETTPRPNVAILFQRALRLEDNAAVSEALQRATASKGLVYSVFCVDPRQADRELNPYASPFAIGFLVDCLRDLQSQLQAVGSDLLVLSGAVHEVVPSVLTRLNIGSVFAVQDYTPFARARTEALSRSLTLTSATLHEVPDALLHQPHEVVASSGFAFKVFTPFYNAVKGLRVAPAAPLLTTYRSALAPASAVLAAQLAANAHRASMDGWALLQANSTPPPFPGGRTACLQAMKTLPSDQREYATQRDYLAYRSTHLSAFIKFGCISAREAWHLLGGVRSKESAEALQRQLVWREFYYHYFISYPEELEWRREPRDSGSDLQLDPSAPPLVRACYNELTNTGWLGNRGRMILASYLLHQQRVYWKDGDRFFARHLVDYDPLVNAGNWKWIARQPPFKQIKPATQVKWDLNPVSKVKGAYVTKWAPITATVAAGRRETVKQGELNAG